MINIYLSFIRPILEYGNVIWDNCTQNEANLLESVQVEAGRIITGLRVNSSRSTLYSELDWEPLYERREKQKLILLYKIINGFNSGLYVNHTQKIFTIVIYNKYRGTILDYPFVILSHIAKVSSLVRDDSGIVCLPQQSPVLLLI